MIFHTFQSFRQYEHYGNWRFALTKRPFLKSRPKMRPRLLQDASKTAQDNPKTAHDDHKTAQDAPKTSQDALKTAQEASKTPQDAPRSPQDAPGRPQDAPKTPQDAPPTRSKMPGRATISATVLPARSVCGFSQLAFWLPP